MIWIIIIVVLLIIAMLCRSLVHTLLHHYLQFDKKFNADDYWWLPNLSWLNKYKVKWTIDLFGWRVAKFPAPVQVTDAFHFFNTIELGAFTLAVTIPVSLWLGAVWYMSIVIFLIVGAILIIIFNIGYDRLWR